MLDEKLTHEALALPLPERMPLAEILWQSTEDRREADFAAEEREALIQARERSAKLDQGGARRTHDQVMDAAQRALS